MLLVSCSLVFFGLWFITNLEIEVLIIFEHLWTLIEFSIYHVIYIESFFIKTYCRSDIEVWPEDSKSLEFQIEVNTRSLFCWDDRKCPKIILELKCHEMTHQSLNQSNPFKPTLKTFFHLHMIIILSCFQGQVFKNDKFIY